MPDQPPTPNETGIMSGIIRHLPGGDAIYNLAKAAHLTAKKAFKVTLDRLAAPIQLTKPDTADATAVICGWLDLMKDRVRTGRVGTTGWNSVDDATNQRRQDHNGKCGNHDSQLFWCSQNWPRPIAKWMIRLIEAILYPGREDHICTGCAGDEEREAPCMHGHNKFFDLSQEIVSVVGDKVEEIIESDVFDIGEFGVGAWNMKPENAERVQGMRDRIEGELGCADPRDVAQFLLDGINGRPWVGVQYAVKELTPTESNAMQNVIKEYLGKETSIVGIFENKPKEAKVGVWHVTVRDKEKNRNTHEKLDFTKHFRTDIGPMLAMNIKDTNDLTKKRHMMKLWRRVKNPPKLAATPLQPVATGVTKGRSRAKKSGAGRKKSAAKAAESPVEVEESTAGVEGTTAEPNKSGIKLKLGRKKSEADGGLFIPDTAPQSNIGPRPSDGSADLQPDDEADLGLPAPSLEAGSADVAMAGVQ